MSAASTPCSLSSILRSRADCVGTGIWARDAAIGLGWQSWRAGELCLVVVELANNAVRHARRGRLRLEIGRDRAALEIADEGPGLPAWVMERHRLGLSVEEGRPAEAAGGLGGGLDAVRRMADDFAIANHPGGATVRAICHAWKGADAR